MMVIHEWQDRGGLGVSGGAGVFQQLGLTQEAVDTGQ